jgi:hypothetical protein
VRDGVTFGAAALTVGVRVAVDCATAGTGLAVGDASVGTVVAAGGTIVGRVCAVGDAVDTLPGSRLQPTSTGKAATASRMNRKFLIAPSSDQGIRILLCGSLAGDIRSVS